MTKEWFNENVTSFGSLIDAARELGCDDLVENIYTEDGMDDTINECYLMDWARYRSWRELLDILSELPTGCEWYFCDDSGDWNGLDDYDFEQWKTEIREEAEYRGLFDDEEEEEEDDVEEEEWHPCPRIGQDRTEEPEEPAEQPDLDGIFQVIGTSIDSAVVMIEASAAAAHRQQAAIEEQIAADRMAENAAASDILSAVLTIC